MNAPIRTALLSVSDKTGLVDFARYLHGQGVTLLSTGGTAKTLKDAGLPVTDVADYTGFPEMMDGRVKTLHPKVHGGLLGRRGDASHRQAMKDHGITPIDLVVINLYPFEATVAKGADEETCIENIDIGGPSMIRSAAKNHESVTIVTDAADYATVQAEMKANQGATTLALRKHLAYKAYSRTAAYDAAISQWFARTLEVATPETLTLTATLRQPLRYGENPHQQAAFYSFGEAQPTIATAEQLQGKELSYNNINDTDAAFELVSEFSRPAVAIIKHANPCGVAEGSSVEDAYAKALACDPVSAFGGIIALNRPLTAALAEEIAKHFYEVILAPAAEEAAKAILATKKNLRLLLTHGMPDAARRGPSYKSVAGGLLVQDRDFGRITAADLKIVTKRQPTEQEIQDLLFAFTVCKHVKSNAIVLVRHQATLGIGAGQMSRVDSARIARQKADTAGLDAKGCAVASDAFFPFADGVLQVVEAGAKAVIQPGGSIRDEEVIAAADEHGLAMVFTGMRHFRH
jgi:phosphoribosylaminoimidazolecarboxamide formyltransferase/IMP cyclohydrolase